MNSFEYKISVIMLNYNNGKYIAEAIESAMMQTGHFKWRLIVADNASTDNSAETIKRYAEKYPDKITMILRPSNIGWYKSILDMFAQMNSEYYCVLCSDDFFTSDRKLADAVEFLDAHPDYTLYCSNWEYLKDGKKWNANRENTMMQDFTFGDYIKDCEIKGRRITEAQELGMVCRNVLYKDGIPAEFASSEGNYFGGDSFRWTASLAKGKAHYVDKVYGCYRVTGEGVWSSLSPVEQSLRYACACIRWGEYFEKINNGFFEYKAWVSTNSLLEILKDSILEKDVALTDEFLDLITKLNAKRELINLFIKNEKPNYKKKNQRHYYRRKFKSAIKNFFGF